MPSEKTPSADNQQETELKVSDEYFCGFVEGEGCFYVGFSKRPDLPALWQVITEFHLSQNPGGKNILESFRKRLGCGYLKPNHPGSKRDKTWVLVIKDRNDLRQKLIPFFLKQPLFTSKKREFLVFKQVLELIEEQKHLNPQGFRQVVNLVFDLPRVSKKRYSKQELISGTSETIR